MIKYNWAYDQARKHIEQNQWNFTTLILAW
jgi:hypothetical protein